MRGLFGKPPMNSKLPSAAILTGLMTLSAAALETTPSKTPPGPPDKEKVSYAMGMNLGFQRKESSADVNTDIFVEGLKDALQAKSLRFQESEIISVLNHARV